MLFIYVTYHCFQFDAPVSFSSCSILIDGAFEAFAKAEAEAVAELAAGADDVLGPGAGPVEIDCDVDPIADGDYER